MELLYFIFIPPEEMKQQENERKGHTRPYYVLSSTTELLSSKAITFNGLAYWAL